MTKKKVNEDVKNWFQRRMGGITGARAEAEYLSKGVLKKEVDTLRRAFDDAVSGGLIVKSSDKPPGPQQPEYKIGDMNSVMNNIRKLSPEQRMALKSTIEARIKQLGG